MEAPGHVPSVPSPKSGTGSRHDRPRLLPRGDRLEDRLRHAM